MWLRIAEAPRSGEPQLASRPSARRSAQMMDGHELPADALGDGLCKEDRKQGLQGGAAPTAGKPMKVMAAKGLKTHN